MGIGADEKHHYAVYAWEKNPPTILFKGTAGNSPLTMACALPTSFAACGDKEIKVWGHPLLGNQYTTAVEGRRWLVGVRPLTPSWVSCMCAFTKEFAPPAHGSLACGWPDGYICIFEPSCGNIGDGGKQEWNMEAGMKEGKQNQPGTGRGSRFWRGHSCGVTAVVFLPPDRFTRKHSAPDGILLSADSNGKIRAWRVDQSLPGGANKPWELIRELCVDLASFAAKSEASKVQLVPGAELRRHGDTWITVVNNPLDPEVPLRLHARTMRYQGGGSGIVLVGTSANQVILLHLDMLSSGGFEPEVLVQAHTGIVHARTCCKLARPVGTELG